MKTLKNIALTISLIAFIGLNFAITTPTTALNPIWDVECNYDENGDYSGGDCFSGGQYQCACAPRQIPQQQ